MVNAGLELYFLLETLQVFLVHSFQGDHFQGYLGKAAVFLSKIHLTHRPGAEALVDDILA